MPTKTTHLARTARWFYALSDETRLQVIELLLNGERCVCDLQVAIGAAQSRLSFHLRVLREAGLVNDRRSGRWVHYSLRPDAFEQIAAFINEHSPKVAVWASPGSASGDDTGSCA